MDDQRLDINFFLGSWGSQPEDDLPVLPKVDPAELLKAADWREMAERWSEQALGAIREGQPEMAGEYARGAARFCLRYQLAGGRPDAE